MSDPNDKSAGRYAPGNETEDGSYKVGKGKPPESGQYREGDGRPRGRRKKGTKNHRTDFEEEMASTVTVTVNGKPRKVSSQRAIFMRLADNARRGQNSAIQTVLKIQEKHDAAAQTGNGQNPEIEEDITLCFDELTVEELLEFNRLWRKVKGPVPTSSEHPFAWLSDPEDSRNWHLKGTLDGLHYRGCSIPTVGKQLIGMDNLAYRRTALARKQTFDRTRY